MLVGKAIVGLAAMPGAEWNQFEASGIVPFDQLLFFQGRIRSIPSYPMGVPSKRQHAIGSSLKHCRQ